VNSPSDIDYAAFGRIMGNAFQSGVRVNEHQSSYTTIRVRLTEHRSEPENEADIRECEATGQIWEAYWFAGSTRSYSWVAGSFEALVRKVLSSVNGEMEASYAHRYPERLRQERGPK